jgi:hypothetical protein
MLETELKKNTAAMEALTKALLETGTAAAPAGDDEEKPTSRKGKGSAASKGKGKGKDDDGEEGGEVTLKELRAIARPLVKAKRSAEIKELCEEFDATSLTNLDEEHYEEVKERLEELAAEED